MLNVIPSVGMLLAMTPPFLIGLSMNPLDLQFIIAGLLVIIPTAIAGVIIFGNAFGLLGMILAIPILATPKIIYPGLKQSLRHQFSGS